MATYRFKLPDIGEGIAEAEVVAWHVKVGDRVEEDQQLADMMTDKPRLKWNPRRRTVDKLAGEFGDLIAIGSVLVVIEPERLNAIEPRTNSHLATGSVVPTPRWKKNSDRRDPDTSHAPAPRRSEPVEGLVILEAFDNSGQRTLGGTRKSSPPPRSVNARATLALTLPR
jgi:2-oxoisovalerate dehydrogenase E2 component (dihydrolipoyl transacylase)